MNEQTRKNLFCFLIYQSLLKNKRMNNSDGIVQDKTETTHGIKALIRKRFQVVENGALEQSMQRNYENKHFSEMSWLKFPLAAGWTRKELKSSIALLFYYFSVTVLENVSSLRQVRNQGSDRLV